MPVILLFSLLIVATIPLQAQERLYPLESNPALIHTQPWKKIQHSTSGAKALIYGDNYVINSNVLNLPFVDDFSSSRLPDGGFPFNAITDSVLNASGACVINSGINYIQARFMVSPSWQYFFDVAGQKTDSTPKPGIVFNYLDAGINDCINASPSAQFTLYPEYYSYRFDSATGQPIDSVLMTDDAVNQDTLLEYAPVIYYANLRPDWLWMDRYAWVNRSFPVFPPTLGVATLDGLDETGRAYNNRLLNAYGPADELTSKPIDLSTYSNGDSIYISFFYEPQGLGDWPNLQDSLILEFLDDFEQWIGVWSVPGFQRLDSVTNFFKQVLIPVQVLPFHNFFHNKFQFRFRNLASLSGNNDHWHIDYVRLDRNRFSADSVIIDIGYIQDMPSVLKNYYLMPADQYSGNSDLSDSISLGIRNNEAGTAPATNYNQKADLLFPASSPVFTSVTQAFNASAVNYLSLNPSRDFVLPALNNDSMLLFTESSISPSDINPANDTIRTVQVFSNLLAYDDGSAERAYGLEGLGLKKFAYEFELNQPDTLVAFQVLFTQINENVNDLIFSFQIWDSLRLNDVSYTDTAVISIENRKPYYVDSINGFTTYVLDTPIIIPSKVYVGWAQTDTRNLQIGYDLNSNKGYRHMYIYTNAQWKRSLVTPEGSPMIRLIFDTDYQGFTTTVRDLRKQETDWAVYPNPANNELQIHPHPETDKQLFHAFDLSGKKFELRLSGRQLDLSALSPGFYMLVKTDLTTGQSSSRKFIKVRP
jgi:hypothetical protein